MKIKLTKIKEEELREIARKYDLMLKIEDDLKYTAQLSGFNCDLLNGEMVRRISLRPEVDCNWFYKWQEARHKRGNGGNPRKISQNQIFDWIVYHEIGHSLLDEDQIDFWLENASKPNSHKLLRELRIGNELRADRWAYNMLNGAGAIVDS